MAALVPAAVASAFTLSVNSVTLNAPIAAATNVTFTVTLNAVAGDPPTNSGQGLMNINKSATNVDSGMTWSATAAMPAASPYGSGAGWTGNPFNVSSTSRGRLLFGPDNDADGQSDEMPMVTGVLFTIQATVPVGAAPGTYPVVVSGPDTYMSDLQFNQFAASAISNGALVILPEPASALLLLGALPFLRRRTA